ncbi:MAG: gliding motility-associated C-terminal domain-containing protein, partial [Bacteroidota bacterium]
ELAANLPTGTTGIWTSLDADANSILETTSASTMVTVDNTNVGTNRFVWTLSSAECPSYSADTVSLLVEGAPDARDDFIELDLLQAQTATIRLIANDNLTTTPNWSITEVTSPTIGMLEGEVVDGSINYAVGTNLLDSAEDIFEYTICNENCADLCATAAIRVSIAVDPDARTSTYNAITPNGDGLNDMFVFDILALGSERYQNSELIIFNRWGDVVFEQTSYDNTWGGQSSSGSDLPEGTYYFILRLNAGDGNVLRGDVAIIR